MWYMNDVTKKREKNVRWALKIEKYSKTITLQKREGILKVLKKKMRKNNNSLQFTVIELNIG